MPHWNTGECYQSHDDVHPLATEVQEKYKHNVGYRCLIIHAKWNAFPISIGQDLIILAAVAVIDDPRIHFTPQASERGTSSSPEGIGDTLHLSGFNTKNILLFNKKLNITRGFMGICFHCFPNDKV